MTGTGAVIIGGGLAGISAALDCARGGAAVTLLESRGRLGGAAYSFSRDGLSIDNGQHVFLRCCTAYRGLLDELGAAEMVTLQERLDVPVLAPDGRRGRLRRDDRLRAPLHLARSLLRYPFLTPRERLSVAVTMQLLGRVDVDDPRNDAGSFGEWLARHRQHRAAIESIWELIIRPTVNLTVGQASLAQAAQVFQVGLLGDARAGDIGWAAVPLSEIHDRRARAALAGAGVDVRLRCGARAITQTPGGFRVTTADGAELEARTVVVALSPARAARVLPPEAGIDPALAERLGSSPIVNLHVVYDRTVMADPLAAGVGTPVQWVFDRTRSSGLADGQYLAVSLSAADEDLGATAEELQRRYLPALSRLFPEAAEATVRSFFVTREHAATFRAAPGARTWRARPQTKLQGLLLAGSWTDTGWPATMEGAVRSGRMAAAAALAATADRSHEHDLGVSG